MNIGISSLPLSHFENVDAERYNNKVAAIEDAADLTTTVDGMNQLIDQYNTLWTLSLLYHTKNASTVAVKAVEALVPSTEVTIFTIGKSIIKALYNVCKWVLNAIYKVGKFFFVFFKRGDKDIRKDIEAFRDKVPYMQNEIVSPAVSESEIAAWVKIMEEHSSGSTVTHSIQPGTKLDAYKTMFYTAFNAKMPATAKVNPTGAIVSAPRRLDSATALHAMGWTTGDKFVSALDSIGEAENKIKGVITGLKEQSKEIANVAKLCEKRIIADSSQLSNIDLAEKAPQCVDAACVVTIMSKDLINLKRLKHSYGNMCSTIRTRAKKYTA